MHKTTVTKQYQCFYKYDIRAIQISSLKSTNSFLNKQLPLSDGRQNKVIVATATKRLTANTET